MAPTAPAPGYRVKELAYIVPSATDAGVVYDVTLDARGYHCSCKATQFPKTKGRCWHIKSVTAGMFLGKPRARLAVAPELVPSVNPSGWLWEA